MDYKYEFKPYSEKYKDYFKQEKYKLDKIIKVDCPIEHIGSTAVPGLGGKGTVDVMVVAAKKKRSFLDTTLRKNNYDFCEDGGNSDRLFYQRDYRYNHQVRRVHLHLVDQESNSWQDNIAFRDYLRENPEDAAKYEQIKMAAAKICEGDKGIYREYKHRFIQSIIKKIKADRYEI